MCTGHKVEGSQREGEIETIYFKILIGLNGQLLAARAVRGQAIRILISSLSMQGVPENLDRPSLLQGVQDCIERMTGCPRKSSHHWQVSGTSPHVTLAIGKLPAPSTFIFHTTDWTIALYFTPYY